MANNDCTQVDSTAFEHHHEREARLKELENTIGQEIDRSKLDAMERKVILVALGELEECLHGLRDVQSGLSLILSLHSHLVAGEEPVFLNVLDILTSVLKDRIEQSMEMIP